MLRTELRRHERRATIRRRLLATSTAAVLALGMAAGGLAPALAAPPASTLPTPIVDAGGVTTYDQGGLVCNASSIGFQKPSALDNLGSNDGQYSAAWGTIKWDASERTVSWSIVDGWDVDVCVKGGTVLSLLDTSVNPGTSYTHTYAGLSHLGFRINASTPGNDLDCVTATNFQGRALTNGDHINMDIVQNGVAVPVSAQVDIRQAHDPASASGLVVRVNAPGGPYTLPLSIEQRDSGVFSFAYATYLTGTFTVEWVQFNSTYFNKERVEAQFLVCGDDEGEQPVTPTARMVDLTCDAAGSYTLDDVEGIRWFIGDDEVQPGTYGVSTAATIVVRAEAESPEFALAAGADDEFTFVFTAPDDCVLPCLPASAVAYTYYNLSTATSVNPANSGLITVTAREGYSDELCSPFWVVAAAWDFSSSTSIWPQTLRSTDPAGDHAEGYIDSVGTYFYHAPVDCGQGDVYASFDAKPYVGPELYGPSNPFTERFLHQMGFTGPNPTYLVTAPGCNVANPIAPTAVPILECGTDGSIDISDVENPYVGYTVYRGAADNSGSVAGLEQVSIDEATEGVFTVVATPLNGYIFAPGTVRQWQFDLGERYECPIEVDLRLTYMEECAPDSTYTFRVRNAESVSVPYTYVVAGNPSLNGSGIAAPGDSFFDLDVDRTNPAQSYTVTLHWGDGTSIEADSTVKASGRDKVCTLTVQPVADIECAADGSYTVPSVLGVVWSIAGTAVQPGTYTVTEASTIVLRATAANGYVLYDGGTLSSTRDFTLEFTEPEVCDPPTLNLVNAQLAFIDPTCESGQLLDVNGFSFDSPLVELESSSVEGGAYTVVFRVADDAPDFTVFDQSPDVTVDGRAVTDDGTTLTFTGTLGGALPSEECELSVIVIDPYGFVDTCLEEQTYWVDLVEGITYTITVDDNAPVVVEWEGTDEVRTFSAEPGSSLRIEAAPASELFTLAPEPGPLEHTFAVYEDGCLPTLPLTEGSVTFTPASCLDETNWVTLPATEGVQWWVDGKATAAGKWAMPAGDVVVEATPIEGYGFGPEAETRWEYTYPTAEEACDESSLAETGASNSIVGVGIAALLITVAGLGVVIGRRHQQA